MTRECKNQIFKTWQLIGKLRQILEKQMNTWLRPEKKEEYKKFLE